MFVCCVFLARRHSVSHEPRFSIGSRVSARVVHFFQNCFAAEQAFSTAVRQCFYLLQFGVGEFDFSIPAGKRQAVLNRPYAFAKRRCGNKGKQRAKPRHRFELPFTCAPTSEENTSKRGVKRRSRAKAAKTQRTKIKEKGPRWASIPVPPGALTTTPRSRAKGAKPAQQHPRAPSPDQRSAGPTAAPVPSTLVFSLGRTPK